MKEFFPIIRSSQLFSGVSEEELTAMLSCLETRRESFPKDALLLRIGDTADAIGLVLSGSILIIQEDIWGNRNIMARITQGGIFAESFACTGEKLTVGAEAESECEIMRLKVGHVLGSCPKSCAGHAKLVGNLISELARKNLNFNSKLGHMGKRTTREKLMSYLSAQAMKSGKNEFDIPFDRQQLADYLCVDRSAMSAQLCALRDDGILKFKKNHFILNRI